MPPGNDFQKRKISLPRRRPANVPNQITGQTVVVHSHRVELRLALVEQIQLPILAAIGFKRHQRDTQGTRFLNHLLHQRPRHRLQQVQIVQWLARMKPAILLKHIREEVTQTAPPARDFVLTGPTQRDCLRQQSPGIILRAERS